jgi:hypothetical protein
VHRGLEVATVRVFQIAWSQKHIVTGCPNPAQVEMTFGDAARLLGALATWQLWLNRKRPPTEAAPDPAICLTMAAMASTAPTVVVTPTTTMASNLNDITV